MREKRSGSLKKEERTEKGASLSRALSWLSVSSLSQQTRKLFRSQNSLNRHSHVPHGADEDDDWVYAPQHYIGEGSHCVSFVFSSSRKGSSGDLWKQKDTHGLSVNLGRTKL